MCSRNFDKEKWQIKDPPKSGHAVEFLVQLLHEKLNPKNMSKWSFFSNS